MEMIVCAACEGFGSSPQRPCVPCRVCTGLGLTVEPMIELRPADAGSGAEDAHRIYTVDAAGRIQTRPFEDRPLRRTLNP